VASGYGSRSSEFQRDPTKNRQVAVEPDALVLAGVLLRARDLMLCLGAQPFGVVPKPPRPLDLTQMVPFGERGAATVTKRDVRVEREENVLMAAIVATLAEELPLQVSIVRVLDVEEDVPVDLGQGRGPRPAFAHDPETTPKRSFRQRPLVTDCYKVRAGRGVYRSP
jgi:hypothetical protein